MNRLYTVTIQVTHQVQVEADDVETAVEDAERQLRKALDRHPHDFAGYAMADGSVDEVEAAGYEHDDYEVAHAE